jgi:predicted aminopeptidase
MGARPVEDVLKDPGVDPQVKKYLQISQRVLEFASTKLGMNTKGNYRKYAELRERWVSHVVIAAHKDRLEPHLFHYPLYGGLPYRGYFKVSDAVSFANKLRAQGLDVHVRPVPAYSTTGWLSDPIVTSMFVSEANFIDVLLHELVHVQFYLNSEADFNEAFATWFARKASRRFVEESDFAPDERAALLTEFDLVEERDRIRDRWVHRILKDARDFYASAEFLEADASAREPLRTRFFEKISQDLATEPLMERWAKIEWNNAVLVSLSTYHDLVNNIDALAKSQGWSEIELLRSSTQNARMILDQLKINLASGCSNSSEQSPADRAKTSDSQECFGEEVSAQTPTSEVSAL